MAHGNFRVLSWKNHANKIIRGQSGQRLVKTLACLFVFSLGLSPFSGLEAEIKAQAPEPMIVPKPVDLSIQAGAFALTEKTTVKTDEDSRPAALMLTTWLSNATGQPITLAESGAISLKIDPSLSELGDEGYRLNITPEAIAILSAKYAGVVNAVQTLRQLLPVSAYATGPSSPGSSVSLPCLVIQDGPVYAWRGMMLDVARQFLDKKYVLRYIDMMATHKLNVLHLHLTDDCGWRVEIKKYPKLTEIGAFRGEGTAREGGFYTQDEIREIIAYAKIRNITIIPEIEVPAHALASIVAYPWLSCTGKQHVVPSHHFISDDLYCPSKETTWTFLEDLLTEICELFPSTYIHIGGDEAKYNKWKNCAGCQAKIKELGLKNEQALQGWMTCKLEEMLRKKNKLIIGWDEILRCGVSLTAGIMPWHDAKAARDAAKLGNPIVQAPTAQCYFDTPESKLLGEWPGADWIPPVSLWNAYNWDPMPDNLSPKQQKNVLGAQGCLWTDQFLHKPWIKAKYGPENYCDYLTLPRAAALAEVTWTPKNSRNWEDFQRRMTQHYLRYSSAGWVYRLPLPNVNMLLQEDGSAKITASSPVLGGSVLYTVDGSIPTATSPKLESLVTVPVAKLFRAVSLAPDGKTLSLAYANDPKPNPFASFGTSIGEWKSGEISKSVASPVDFNATGIINADGVYQVTFAYTSGSHGLSIQKIELYRNQDLLTSDLHLGFTGAQAKDNIYTLKVDGYQTGAAFKIRAYIYADGGDHSNGVVLLKKK